MIPAACLCESGQRGQGVPWPETAAVRRLPLLCPPEELLTEKRFPPGTEEGGHGGGGEAEEGRDPGPAGAAGRTAGAGGRGAGVYPSQLPC